MSKLSAEAPTYHEADTPELRRWRLVQAGQMAAELAYMFGRASEQLSPASNPDEGYYLQRDENTLAMADNILALTANEEFATFLGREDLKDSPLSITLEELYKNHSMSVRLFNSLMRGLPRAYRTSDTYPTVRNLLSAGPDVLKELRGMGGVRYVELQNILNSIGVILPDK